MGLVMSGSKFHTSSGDMLYLGEQIGGGGEGKVFAVRNREDMVAKIYHSHDARRSAKLSVMHKLKDERLLTYTAWPMDTIQDERGKEIIGLLMKRIPSEYKDIHQLYSPKTRHAHFPEAGMDLLIHAASNVARAFAVVHENGHVIGDVNHSNVLVSSKGMVMLIDCDSFQITHGNGLYLCQVGVSTHQPPELQSQSLKEVVRIPNHDNFGLAVLIFQILFMGRHPFSGRYLGSGEMPIEKAISEYRFAYGPSAKANLMQQPPGTLTFETYSNSVSGLFERAFSIKGSEKGGRPTAFEWLTCLDQLKRGMATCSANKAHCYPKNLNACPWCSLEAKVGLVFFKLSVPAFIPKATDFKLEVVWANINSVKLPSPMIPPILSIGTTPPSGKAVQILENHRQKKLQMMVLSTVVAAISGLSMFIGSFGVYPFLGFVIAIILMLQKTKIDRGALAEFEMLLKESSEKWSALNVRSRSPNGEVRFKVKLDELASIRSEYLNLPQIRNQKLGRLRSEQKAKQLEDYLDKFFIANAQIASIGRSRKTTLQSYGIETAKDISRHSIISIPGFGASLTNNLVAWRDSIEREFVFDPKKNIPQSLINEIEKEIYSQRLVLESKLLNGKKQLELIATEISSERIALQTEMENCSKMLTQAEVDLNYLKA